MSHWPCTWRALSLSGTQCTRHSGNTPRTALGLKWLKRRVYGYAHCAAKPTRRGQFSRFCTCALKGRRSFERMVGRIATFSATRVFVGSTCQRHALRRPWVASLASLERALHSDISAVSNSVNGCGTIRLQQDRLHPSRRELHRRTELWLPPVRANLHAQRQVALLGRQLERHAEDALGREAAAHAHPRSHEAAAAHSHLDVALRVALDGCENRVGLAHPVRRRQGDGRDALELLPRPCARESNGGQPAREFALLIEHRSSPLQRSLGPSIDARKAPDVRTEHDLAIAGRRARDELAAHLPHEVDAAHQKAHRSHAHGLQAAHGQALLHECSLRRDLHEW
mmetsp:Transcript_21629/g.47283  ORF Transcript_21629/g.47283 Transcript_21629/m.47283 type:complete len:340 (+) Transcript_21629:220-1239(+)